MGGHGGLNILPQKRWNVYNYDNREKVRRDEEAAAKAEQLKREDARRRDSEFRLQQLRAARGLEPIETEKSSPAPTPAPSEHINLFEGIRMFDLEAEGGDRDEPSKKKRKMKKEEEVKIVSAEDEKYRVGYGVAGKGVKAPWYLQKKKPAPLDTSATTTTPTKPDETKNGGSKSKKSLEELRAERLSRERREKQRERALIQQTKGRF